MPAHLTPSLSTAVPPRGQAGRRRGCQGKGRHNHRNWEPQTQEDRAWSHWGGKNGGGARAGGQAVCQELEYPGPSTELGEGKAQELLRGIPGLRVNGQSPPGWVPAGGGASAHGAKPPCPTSWITLPPGGSAGCRAAWPGVGEPRWGKGVARGEGGGSRGQTGQPRVGPHP